MKEIGQQFAQLFAALESPATIDRNELLTAASHFLDAAQEGDPDGLPPARRMAMAAMDFAVWPERYPKLYAACPFIGIVTSCD